MCSNFNIDRKSFSVQREANGACLMEKQTWRCFKIFLREGEVSWWVKEIEALRRGDRDTQWACTFRGQGHVLSLRISVTNHGRFFLLEKIPVIGGVVKVRIPEGEIGAGWLTFVETFKGLWADKGSTERPQCNATVVVLLILGGRQPVENSGQEFSTLGRCDIPGRDLRDVGNSSNSSNGRARQEIFSHGRCVIPRRIFRDVRNNPISSNDRVNGLNSSGFGPSA